MNAFKPGDLVVVLGSNKNSGCVSSVASKCIGCECAIFSEMLDGLSFYQLTGIADMCFRENVLKKIDGDRPKAETKTDETRDEPVEA